MPWTPGFSTAVVWGSRPSILTHLAHVPTTGQTAQSPVAVRRADATAATSSGNPKLNHPLSSSLFAVSRSHYLQDDLGPIWHQITEKDLGQEVSQAGGAAPRTSVRVSPAAVQRPGHR